MVDLFFIIASYLLLIGNYPLSHQVMGLFNCIKMCFEVYLVDHLVKGLGSEVGEFQLYR